MSHLEAASAELKTIRDILRWGMSRFREAQLFYGHGTDNAWDEAVALVLHALHLPMDLDRDLMESRLTLQERCEAIQLLLQRIEDRIPAPYLTHRAYFAGLEFYVDRRVLIPRSAFGELIEQGFAPWVQSETVGHILEIGTGSGCMAIACALAFPEAHIDAVDISEDALAVAKINVERHGVSDQVHLLKSDIFSAVPKRHYDLIISNPPYVDDEDMASLPEEYRHEPVLGLSGGQDGLTIVSKILKEAANRLTPSGILVVEVGNSEVALRRKFPELPFTWLSSERDDDGGIFLLTRGDLNGKN